MFNDIVGPILLIPAMLLIISGITHILQIKFFVKDRLMTAAVLWGVLYLLLGVGILLGGYSATIGIIGLVGAKYLPILGAAGGLYRFIKYQRKGLIIFHVLVDLLILLFFWSFLAIEF